VTNNKTKECVMNQKVGPAVIALAVVILAGVIFAICKISFAPQSPPPSPEYAPAYAKPSMGKEAYGSTYEKGAQYTHPHPYRHP
jgi:hypothetical protein